MKILKPGPLVLTGLVLVVCAFFYDVIFAGIPYQDPPDALQAQWEFHKSVAERAIFVGVALVLAGVAGMIFREVMRRR